MESNGRKKRRSEELLHDIHMTVLSTRTHAVSFALLLSLSLFLCPPLRILGLLILFVCMPIDFIDNTKYHKFRSRPTLHITPQTPSSRRWQKKKKQKKNCERKKVSPTRWELKLLSTFMTHFLFSNMHFLISSFLSICAGRWLVAVRELVTVLFIACSFRSFCRFHHFSFFFLLFARFIRTQRCGSKNASSGSLTEIPFAE